MLGVQEYLINVPLIVKDTVNFWGVMSLDKFHTYPLPHGKHRSYINTDNNTAVRQVTQDIRMHIHLNRVRNKHNIELQFKQ